MGVVARKWDTEYKAHSGAEYITKTFDMGDNTTVKDIYRILVTVAGSSPSSIDITIYYRFHGSENWRGFGKGTIKNSSNISLDIFPGEGIGGNIVDSNIITQTTGTYDDGSSFSKLTNGKEFQFKLVYKCGLHQYQTATITDISIEYRKHRSKNIEDVQS